MKRLRKLLLFVGWSSVVGSVGDGALGLYALLVVYGGADPLISLDSFLKQHVEAIYWVKQVAYYVMPGDFVVWLFAIPALVYFPVRIVMSAVIGWWALRKAATMSSN